MPHVDIDVDRQLERLRERRGNVRFQWHATGAIRRQRLVCLQNVDRWHGVYQRRLRRSGAGYRETMRDRCDVIYRQRRHDDRHNRPDGVHQYSHDGIDVFDDAVHD